MINEAVVYMGTVFVSVIKQVSTCFFCCYLSGGGLHQVRAEYLVRGDPQRVSKAFEHLMFPKLSNKCYILLIL